MPPDRTVKESWSQKLQVTCSVYVLASSLDSTLAESPYTKHVFALNRILFYSFSPVLHTRGHTKTM